MKKFTAFMFVVAFFLAACTSSGVSTAIEITVEVSTVIAETMGPPSTTGPSATLVPATLIPSLPASTFSPTELKYGVLDQFPDLFFCDPDYYPVAREDEVFLAQERFPELQAYQEEFQAILNRNGLSGVTTFTEEQKLLIYREHKKLNAITFELVGDKYKFQIQTGFEGQQGFFTIGTIDGNGSVEIQEQNPSFPTCPICLAAGTLIDTPQGQIPIEGLQVGDSVWTVSASGERIFATILKTGRVIVPASHRMVHVMLSDERELWVSPGHPVADGRIVGEIKAGDLLDGAFVTQVEIVLYDRPATYDLLPSGGTGFYWANGILMGSTLVDK